MKPRGSRSRFPSQSCYGVIAILCVAVLAPDQRVLLAQQAQSQVMTTTTTEPAAPAEEAPKIPNDQLDSLVAPIALYPDPLLGQTLAASTYPLEIVQLDQWMEKNKSLKDKALADAVEKQAWDPSVQAMAAFPDVLTRLADNIAWTSDLGNAFLAQQADVMAAVQRMRAKAQGTGSLKTSAQQKVETQTVEGGKQVIVIEQADPKVVYVPSYDPVVVYGPPVYPYYPYSYPGYVAGRALWFGAGVALGAAWGGHWGYGCGWGHNDVNINVNNKYVSHYNRTNINNKNVNNFNRTNINRPAGNNNNWQHNPQHRGGVPYGDRRTANNYGGRARGQQPGTGVGNRPGSAGNRPGAGAGNIGANRPGGGAGNIGDNRPGGGAGADRPGGGAGATRPSGGGKPSTLPANRPGGGGGGDRIGNRSVSSGSRGGGGSGAFGGAGGGSARASSDRGGRSMGGGGMSGGGGRRGR